MNKKIGRNFEVLTPCDFIAAITQHIPDKSLWAITGGIPTRCAAGGPNQAGEEVQTGGDAVEVIDVSAHEPRRIPSKKWRELIKKVWEAGPLRCPMCSREMRIVSLHRRGGSHRAHPAPSRALARGVRVHPGTDPPALRREPCLTSGYTFVTLRQWKRTLSASDSGPTPRRAKGEHFVRDIGLIQGFLGAAFGIFSPAAIPRDFPAVTLPAPIGVALTAWVWCTSRSTTLA